MESVLFVALPCLAPSGQASPRLAGSSHAEPDLALPGRSLPCHTTPRICLWFLVSYLSSVLNSLSWKSPYSGLKSPSPYHLPASMMIFLSISAGIMVGSSFLMVNSSSQSSYLGLALKILCLWTTTDLTSTFHPSLDIIGTIRGLIVKAALIIAAKVVLLPLTL